MLGGWGFRFGQIKALAPYGPNKGQNKENLINLQKYSSHEPPAGMH